MARIRAGLQEERAVASHARARCRGVVVVGLLAACGLVAQASCGFVSGSSFARSNSMSRKTGITAAATPRAIDAAAKKYILESVKHDLQNQFTDGFVYTPFRPGVSYSTPFVTVRGKSMSEAMKRISPVSALYKFMVEDDTSEYRIKRIEETSGDVNPFADTLSPPMAKVQDTSEDAAWAIHVQWEMEAQGRVHFAPVIEQKPFYLSGNDVFRFDASGRVVSHERGFDQDLKSVASYFNPIHHFPSLDSILPFGLAQKPE